jgi:hypothetical protein
MTDRASGCASQPGQPVGERPYRKLQSRLRDELLDGEIFYTLREAQIVIESWRRTVGVGQYGYSKSTDGMSM